MVLTTLAAHGTLSERDGLFPLFIGHRAHPPRFRLLLLRAGLLEVDGFDRVGSGDRRIVIRTMKVPFGLLSHATPIARSGAFFGEGFVQAGAGDCEAKRNIKVKKFLRGKARVLKRCLPLRSLAKAAG